jgi:hypothetical protein
MGVGEVAIESPSNVTQFAHRDGSGWARSPLAAGGAKFERPSREGQVTWSSEGATGVTRQAGLTRILIDTRNDTNSPGMLVVARAWYPAWLARLNGVPLRVRPLAGALIAVDLPPQARGRLILSFWPAGLTAGLALAALGALLVVAGALAPGRVEGLAGWVEGLLVRRGPARINAA